ncbi:hypothetical protein PsYK624_040040 [Phanerochaete sordida]|uniref:Uncharacterized protein n=1 Tax=Phanerochaete sordida TaxID=48140 RepID=A0A9P3G445_9APHY|nr:hypothetical protein PsYK624_040040 [Phanerochaete sordida]
MAARATESSSTNASVATVHATNSASSTSPMPILNSRSATAVACNSRICEQDGKNECRRASLARTAAARVSLTRSPYRRRRACSQAPGRAPCRARSRSPRAANASGTLPPRCRTRTRLCTGARACLGGATRRAASRRASRAPASARTLRQNSTATGC